MSLSDPTPENLRKAADDFGLSFYKPITLDHIPVILNTAADTIAQQAEEIERLRRGLDNDNNRTLACEPCNRGRGNSMPELSPGTHREV